MTRAAVIGRRLAATAPPRSISCTLASSPQLQRTQPALPSASAPASSPPATRPVPRPRPAQLARVQPCVIAPEPTTLVVGGGLVGTYLATTLAASGARVVLKTASPVDASAPATRVCRAAGVAVVDDLAVLADALDPAHGGGGIDLTLVTTKTYDHAAVARELAAYGDRLAPSLATVLCHNGYVLGSAETFSPAARGAPVYKALVPGGYSFASCEYAAGSNNASAPPRFPRLVVTNGDAPWGVVGGDADAAAASATDAADSAAPASSAGVAAALAARGVSARGGRSAQAADVKKFLVNASANLLAVAADANCATLVSDPALVARMRTLFHEADALLRAAPAHAAAFRMPDDEDDNDDAVAAMRALLLPDSAALANGVVAGVGSYGAHYPSSHKDFVAGRRLEIDSLNGYVVALGEKLGVSVDTHRELIDEVEALVAKRDTP